MGEQWQDREVVIVGKGMMIGSPLHALLRDHYKLSRLSWVDRETVGRDQVIREAEVVVLCTGQP